MGGVVVNPFFHHVSRHLVDRPKGPAVDWNMLGVGAEGTLGASRRIRVGGSVPVCELFQQHLGVYTVGFGFALDDEQFHAPNEFFRLSSFDRGRRAYCMLLERLGAERA